MKLKADLHVHSTFSDGKIHPRDILLVAHNKGLDVIAVSDHDTFEGSIRAVQAAKSLNLEIVALIAAEIRTNSGDVLVYCSEKPLSRIPRQLEELVDVAHEEGCIVVAAHPYDIRRLGVGDLVYKVDFDAIEVFNAMSDPASNRKAMEAAKRLGKPGIASSDAHVPEFIGAAYTLIDAEPSPDDVIDAIRRGRVTPVPGRPGPLAYVKTVVWGIERRLRRRREGPSRLDYLEEEFQDYAPV